MKKAKLRAAVYKKQPEVGSFMMELKPTTLNDSLGGSPDERNGTFSNNNDNAIISGAGFPGGFTTIATSKK